MLHERFQQVDKAQLARRFGAAARHYDAHARFQQEVGQALLDLMPDRPVGSELTVCGLDLDTAVYRRGLPDSLPDGLPETGLDLGCGTGFFLPALAGRCQQLHGLDLAPGMLAQAALRGSGALSLVPLGETSELEISADWPHPGFTDLLPSRHDIRSDGFDAHWQVSHLIRNYPQQMLASRPPSRRTEVLAATSNSWAGAK